MGGRSKMTVEEAREVIAREGDKDWAKSLAAQVREQARTGTGEEGPPTPERVAGRIAAVSELLAPPRVARVRRSKEEVAAEKERKAAEKAAKEKAAKAQASGMGKK